MTGALLTTAERTRFDQLGYLGPVPLFGSRECRRLVRLLKSDDNSPLDWPKGKAASSRLHYEIACLPSILNRVSDLIDGPVMLWGSSVVTRLPGQKHAWHTDIETHGPQAGTVSVWIALEGAGRCSGLALVERSHLVGQPFQQVLASQGEPQGPVENEMIAGWARDLRPDCALVQPGIQNGEAVFFDGRLWHASANANQWLARRALLLQYASPDIAIRAPDPAHLQWPVRTIRHPRPACIITLGSSNPNMNRLVPPPARSGETAGVHLSSVIRTIAGPHLEDASTGWRARHLFAGRSSQIDHQHCHVSTLSAGATPHKPHQHAEEEILIMLSGRAELRIVNDIDSTESAELLNPGDFVYYPASGSHHTLTNRSDAPATYLMFKWHGADKSQPQTRLSLQIHRTADAFQQARQRDRPFATGPLFDGPTEYLGRLHGHVSVVQPGGGYDEHVDAHDVAIVLLDGVIETLGEQISAPSVVYISGGHLHGLNNPGPAPARYLVFEFQGWRNHTLFPGRLDAVRLRHWISRKARSILLRSAFAEGLVRRLISALRGH